MFFVNLFLNPEIHKTGGTFRRKRSIYKKYDSFLGKIGFLEGRPDRPSTTTISLVSNFKEKDRLVSCLIITIIAMGMGQNCTRYSS
jgi:hypothetical protein